MAAGKTALVLGGGGTRGAVETGFIRRLTELEVPIDFVVGTSVGAINAAYVAFHEPQSHDCFREIWAGLRSKRLYGNNPLRIVRNLLGTRMSLYDNSFIRTLIASHLHQDDFSAARIPLHITATNLCTGRGHVFSDGPLVQAILASSAIPGVFPPVRVGDDLFADGGVVGSLDIRAAIELGATRVVAIDLRPPVERRCPANIVDVVTRSIGLLADSRATCSTEHIGFGSTEVVHIQPGLTTTDRGGFRDVDRLLADSYTMARQVFERCWDGHSLVPGHYHPDSME